MAEAKLVAVVEANTKQLENAVKRIERAFNQTERAASKSMKGLDASLKRSATNADAFARSLTGLATSFLGIGAAQQLTKAADAWVVAGNKLAAASEISGRQARSLEDINKIATATRTSIESTVDLYSKLLSATRDVAKSEEEVARATEIVNKSFKAGGQDIAQQTAGILQLGQALGSGVLQGDELRSIRENAPVLAEAIAKEFKTTINGLKELGAAGELTSARVFKGILAAQADVERAFGRTKSTIGDALTLINNAFAEAVGSFDALTGASGGVVGGLKKVTQAIKDVSTVINALAETDIGKAITALTEFQDFLAKWGVVIPGTDLGRQAAQIGRIAGAAAGALGATPATGALDLGKLSQDIGEVAAELKKAETTLIELEKAKAFTGIDAGVVIARDEVARLTGVLADLNVQLLESGDTAVKAAQTMAEAFESARIAAQRSFGNFPSPAVIGEAIGAGGAVSSFVDRVVQAEAPQGGPNLAGASSAFGVGQFIESTWLDLFKRHFPDRAKSMTDSTILALRADAGISRELIEKYAQENAAILQHAGVAVTEAALHLSHFLGAGDAAKVLSAAPGTPLAGLIDPDSIAANPNQLGGGKTVDDAIAFANRRAALPSSQDASQASQDAVDAAADAAAATLELKQAKDAIIDSVNREIEALGIEARAFGQSTFAAEKAAQVFDLTNQFIAAGHEITPELTKDIDAWAASLANAAVQAEGAEEKNRTFQESQQGIADRAIQQADAIRDLSSDVIGGLASDLANGVKPAEALANALQKIAEKLLDIGINALTSGLFGPQGTSFGGIFGSLFGGGTTAAALPMTGLATGLAQGGVMTSHGPVPLKRYGSGGVAHGPQMALFGEGRTPEAFVPLPDGRSIPVRMKVPSITAAGRGSGQQRVSVDNLIKIEPSPLFDVKMESRARQATNDAVIQTPEHMADQKRRVGPRRG